jgi:ABC-type bacteriocin/lantibiotic exporter with double-glycine peptidase domain
MVQPVRLGSLGPDGPPDRLLPYIWRISRWHQIGLGLLALGLTFLGLVPLDLQRRIIDDAIMQRDQAMLVHLAALYLAAILAHNALKFLMKWLQGWLAESAVRRSRGVLLAHERQGRDEGGKAQGASVSVLGAELDRLGGFIGTGPSMAVANLAMLLGVVGYMVAVKPQLAWISLLLMLPNIILTPLLQRRLNALTRVQVATLRDFGDSVLDGCKPDVTTPMLNTLYSNRMAFHLWKNVLKTTLSLLGAAAPLGVLVVGGLLVLEGQASAGMIVAFLSGFQRIAGPIRDLLTFYRDAAQAGVRYEMVRRWM